MTRAQIESRIAELKVENEKAPGGAGTNARAELIRELEAQLPCSAGSARALELADYIEQSTPPTYMDDVMLDRADREVVIAALRHMAGATNALTSDVAQPEQLRSSGHAEQNSSSKTWTAGIDALRQYPYQDEQWHIHAIEFHHKVREEAEATRDRWLASQPSPAATVETEVQDTYLVGGPPDLKAMSGSVESDRVIQLHFRRKATDEDRKWLLEAINAKLLADKSPAQCSAATEDAILTSAKALDYLSDHTRPIGGQDKYNAEHLIDLADKLRTFAADHALNEPQAVPVTHAMVPSWDEEAALQKIAFRDIKIQNLEKALTEVANRTYSSDRRCRLKYDAVAAIYDIASAALRGEGIRPSPLTRPHHSGE